MLPEMGPTPLSAVQLTGILKSWSEGDATALEQLTPLVFAELHRLARNCMAGQPQGHIFQPSALVNEAYVRLLGGQKIEWSNRTHFFAVCARMMRQILIDFARSQDRVKRGNGAPHVDISGIVDASAGQTGTVDLLDLDIALQELARLSPRQAQVVELRYFGGLEIDEVAEVLGVSEPTVGRDWRSARAWLFGRLRAPECTS